VSAVDDLERGRESYAGRAWMAAFGSLSQADQAGSLGGDDLELLATSAYMIGRDDDYLDLLERAHRAYLETGAVLCAVRCAFWVVMQMAMTGEMGGATGWLGRAQRLVERDGSDCVERGYLLLPLVFRHESAGDLEAAVATAAAAAEIGERFGDADLLALAVLRQGHALVRQRRVAEGLGLLDEAMVAVTCGELSPIVSGIVYCGVILGCQHAFDLRRAQEWTAALTRWCEQQPDVVAFTGRCLLHRAEIMTLHGEWARALEEARVAGERQGMTPAGAAQASYVRGEVHRLRGELAAAEDAYREASRCGGEPQPGLALLRLAQGNGDAAAASIRRVVGETSDRIARARLLPAYIEIMLAVGDRDHAGIACRELEEIAAGNENALLEALVAQARGAVALTAGDAEIALTALRRARQAWEELEAPYAVARVRELMGLACRVLGDDDSAALELEAASDIFVQLGAAPDLARVDSLTRRATSHDTHGLTPRELEVLRLVATGETNKAIAVELVLSERTVDRHVSNIFNKLGVSSRAAATAYAYEHQLV